VHRNSLATFTLQDGREMRLLPVTLSRSPEEQADDSETSPSSENRQIIVVHATEESALDRFPAVLVLS